MKTEGLQLVVVSIQPEMRRLSWKGVYSRQLSAQLPNGGKTAATVLKLKAEKFWKD
jgi:hypothetical protein